MLTDSPFTDPLTPERITPLANLAVVAVRGTDAVTFLHSQLTQDIQTLSPSGPDGLARLAAYCTAKGRVLATMVVWREPDDEDGTPQVYMLVRADLAAALVKRLTMFVLRAKVKLAVLPLVVIGVTTVLAEPGTAGGLLSAPWQCRHTSSGTWIGAPSADPRRMRAWWLGTSAEQYAEPHAEADHARWDVEDMAAGLPWLSSATQDLFIPQTLNLDLIDGVSFSKGCYPGQEVVARSHYRGTVKRRMAGGVVETPGDTAVAVVPAADVYQCDQPDAPCGRIINAACVEGVTHVLFEAPLDAVAAGRLHVGSAEGPAIGQIRNHAQRQTKTPVQTPVRTQS